MVCSHMFVDLMFNILMPEKNSIHGVKTSYFSGVYSMESDICGIIQKITQTGKKRCWLNCHQLINGYYSAYIEGWSNTSVVSILVPFN